MKIIDSKGRLFGTISVIDVVVVLIVALLIAGVVIKFTVLEPTAINVDNTPITYEIKLSNAREYTVNALKAGDSVYDSDSGYTDPVGVIGNIETSPAMREFSLINGKTAMLQVDGYYDITLTIEASGKIEEGRYLVNRTYEIGVNSKRNFNTKYSMFEAQITGIENGA
jgi:hypothetical protein